MLVKIKANLKLVSIYVAMIQLNLRQQKCATV